MESGIYKITNPSGFSYIGQSLKIPRRLHNYKKLKCKGQPHLYNSLLKYGYENHVIEILWKCEYDKLNECNLKNKLNILEEEYIKKHNTLHPNGMNLTNGGDSRLPCDLIKEKISITKRKDRNYYYNKFGKDNPSSKKILQYDLEGNFIKEWVGIAETSRTLGISSSNITNVCRGKYSTCGKFVWRYYSDNYPKKITFKVKYKNPKLAQLDMEGNLIKIWNTKAEVFRELNIHGSNICNCINGKYSNTRGYKWKYIEEL